jgi:Nucleotide-diphospho-sugar transferase
MALPVAHPRGRSNVRGRTRSDSSIPLLKCVISHAIVAIVCLELGYGVGTIGMRRSMLDCSHESIQKPFDTTASASYSYSTGTKSNCSQEDTVRQMPFHHKISRMVYDYATIPRDAFNEQMDLGVPYDETIAGAEDVLLLYTNRNSLPNGTGLSEEKISLEPEKAMENCHTVKVILQKPSNNRQQTNQCIAIVPQWESFVVHKFMRVKRLGSPADLAQPLSYVPRSQREDGGFEGIPSMRQHTNPSYNALVEYLQNYDRIIKELKPIFDGVMNGRKDKSRTLVVLTCNKGQSELFRNFVCNARAKGLDLSHVVMFATDLSTYELSRDLGIPAYFDESIFKGMPEQAANKYGDMIFARMMMAKVYCVHLALTSGYSVLFQDVDVVWYQDPLPYLESKKFATYDLVFQDDGSRQPRFAPYSPNSGMFPNHLGI